MIKVNFSIKKILKSFLSKNKLIKRVSISTILRKQEKMYFRITQKQKIQQNLMVFSSFRGRSYSCNPKAIYEEIIKDHRFSHFNFVWFFEEPNLFENLFNNLRTKVVKYYSKEYYKILASSKVWIFNMAVPPYVFPKKEQIYIQTWHGTPLKRIGCDLDFTKNAINDETDIFKSYNREGEIITHLISPSPFATEKLKSAFNLINLNREEIIWETGYPRNDILNSFIPQKQERIKQKLGIPEDKKIILYAPTWRDNQYSSRFGFTYNLQADFNKMQKHLSDQYIILFRAHYLVANSFRFDDYKGFVFDVSDIDDINDLYLVSDLLITDYSSVFFDFANVEKPVIFYMYDLEEYRDEIRGFYLDINELPGPIVQTEEALVEAIIKSIDRDISSDRHFQIFKKKFTNLDDGNASKRVLDNLWKEIN
ncbi:CDP-glycerol glycerophosphotransferase family protein [Spirochaeta isovalerica]|uniref:CDP-glycerol glycerophosphotransferase n=1 Tax=Spirochaeta isovalerica TaxID=150 RepID=A0A841RA24_9SPIO|nr:CDP-glycerol glycerophosphotransferase family protein [Spirochaeta isovalerica]MBB6480743.1 CDP-glycerol glycerophosphotransferase [Spirochaeta isovalerica]